MTTASLLRSSLRIPRRGGSGEPWRRDFHPPSSQQFGAGGRRMPLSPRPVTTTASAQRVKKTNQISRHYPRAHNLLGGCAPGLCFCTHPPRVCQDIFGAELDRAPIPALSGVLPSGASPHTAAKFPSGRCLLFQNQRFIHPLYTYHEILKLHLLFHIFQYKKLEHFVAFGGLLWNGKREKVFEEVELTLDGALHTLEQLKPIWWSMSCVGQNAAAFTNLPPHCSLHYHFSFFIFIFLVLQVKVWTCTGKCNRQLFSAE